MIPFNSLSPAPIAGDFLPPRSYDTVRTRSRERGGVDVQDISQGNDYQDWEAYWDPDSLSIKLRSLGNAREYTLVSGLVDIEALSFCFNSNLDWNLVYKETDEDWRFTYYSTTAQQRVTEMLAPDVVTPKLFLDIKTITMTGEADAILTYVRGTSLCYRQQRDRFEIEHVLKTGLRSGSEIRRFGMSTTNRLQWLFEKRI